jgi:hypothetical protein
VSNVSVCCQLPGGFVTSRRPEEAAGEWTSLEGIQTDAGDHFWVSDTLYSCVLYSVFHLQGFVREALICILLYVTWSALALSLIHCMVSVASYIWLTSPLLTLSLPTLLSLGCLWNVPCQQKIHQFSVY